MALTVGVMPKSTLNPYFQECRVGAEEAARELQFSLRWEGPAEADALRQVEILEKWSAAHLPVVAVSVEDSSKLAPVLRKARSLGTRVLTWDADTDRDARDFTIVQATAESIAHALCFEVGRMLRGSGMVAGITSTLSAPNQNAWIKEFKARLARDSPGLELVDIRPCEDSAEVARNAAGKLLEAHKDLKAIVGFCSPAVPGTAEALKQLGRRDIRVTGVSMPSICRDYIEAGIVDSIVTWKTRDLGYLVSTAAHALATGAFDRGASVLEAGRLRSVIIRDDEIRLGRCHIVTNGNLEAFA
jgi:ABC-type sugar transport system substrate-binding protein